VKRGRMGIAVDVSLRLLAAAVVLAVIALTGPGWGM